MSHKTHRKLGSPFSNLRTLKPSGMLSTCTSHEYSSVAESRASPVFRQLGHQRFSNPTIAGHITIQYAPRTISVPAYFGGCSSPFNQPIALSVFSVSGPSQSKQLYVRLPLPLGGSARINEDPQCGQVGRLAFPMR